MAITAKDMKSWARKHQEEIKVGAVAALIGFFFTHGLPLFDDDYSTWLTQAGGSFFELVKRLLLPFTNEPQSWGYADRPVQVLLYKIFHVVFGYWGTGYFLVKSTVFGALCGALYHWMRKLNIERNVAWAALAIFALSTNTVASLVWHSDFGVYAQLILTLVLFYALPQVDKGPSSTAVYKKGWNGLPKNFSRFLITFFVAVYFGSKVRADVRLAPVILLTYLYIFKKEKFSVYLAPFSATFLATLPWSATMFKQLPPFFPGASGYSGETYASFSLTRVFTFLLGDVFTLRTAPLSVLGGVGLLVVLAGAAYAGWRAYREKLEAPGEKVSFFLVWFGIAVLNCGILGTAGQAQSFQLRYTLLPLVPAVILCAIVFQAAAKEFGRLEWFQPAALTLVALQCVLHFYHDYQHRKDMGHTMVAVDKMFRTMETTHANAQMVFLPGFLGYGYRPSTAPSLLGRKSIGDAAQLNGMPTGTTYAISWNSSLDPKYSLESVATGCGPSLFDLIFSCAPTEGAMLLRYVGVPKEMAEADQLDRKGDLTSARNVLNDVWNKDPGNHGLAFTLSLFNYRLGDTAAMERVYDSFGPYFMSHGSVVYNWGLAKQGQKKYREAAALLEKAFAIWPGEFGVGMNLASAYYNSGKKSRALATLNVLMKNWPNDQNIKNTYSDWSK